MNRRQLLTTAAFVALMGCQQAAGIVTSLPQWAQDAQTIGAALGTVASTLTTVTGLPAAALAKIQGAVASVQTIASQIASMATSATTGGIGGLVSGFGSAVSTAIGTIGRLSVPAWVSTAISAVSTLLPTILSVAGVVLAGPPGAGDPAVIATARSYLLALAH